MQRFSGKLLRGGLLAAAFFAQMDVAAGETRLLGASSCGSSACHAASSALPTANVAQDEYRRWATSDPHSRAWASLDGANGREMAGRLGIADPGAAPRCLACHTARAPDVETGPKFTNAEGVGCEACHGPAANWIGPHSRGFYSYREVIAAGLFPTADLPSRAAQCLRCHATGAGRVDHGLIAAGHPVPDFDLAAYTRLQPAHFILDRDYVQRKHPQSEATAWGIGAAAALAGRMRSLAASLRNGTGTFPELSLLNCNACHVAISDWARPGTLPPPQPIMALGEVDGLKALAAGLDPALASDLERTATALLRRGQGKPALAGEAEALAGVAERLGQTIASRGVDGAQARAALSMLVASNAGDTRTRAFAVRAFARTALEQPGADLRPALEVLAAASGGGLAGLREDDDRLRAAVQRAAAVGETRK